MLVHKMILGRDVEKLMKCIILFAAPLGVLLFLFTSSTLARAQRTHQTR